MYIRHTASVKADAVIKNLIVCALGFFFFINQLNFSFKKHVDESWLRNASRPVFSYSVPASFFASSHFIMPGRGYRFIA